MKSSCLIQKDGCRAFYVDGQKNFIHNIFFFNDGKIIGLSSNGFLNDGEENMFQQVIFNKEIKNKRKLNLYEKQVYTYQNDLFIHTDLLKNFKLRKNAIEINEPFFKFIFDEISFTIEAVKYTDNDYKNYSYERKTEYGLFDVTIKCRNKVEETELYKKCKEISKKAMEQYVYISEHDVQKLLQIFDITIK